MAADGALRAGTDATTRLLEGADQGDLNLRAVSIPLAGSAWTQENSVCRSLNGQDALPSLFPQVQGTPGFHACMILKPTSKGKHQSAEY